MTGAGLPAQTPAGGEIFLDHVGWFVSDIDGAARRLGRLGFPTTPLTVHMNAGADGREAPSGTANRCAMIRRGYLELLTRTAGADTPLAAEVDAALARHEGLHLAALSVADTAAAARRLRRAGFEPAPPVALRRPMPLDSGGAATAGFSVLRLAPGAMPEGRVQILAQETPEVVWQPSVTAADNGAEALSGLLVCVADPGEAAGRFSRLAGRPARAGAGGCLRIALDRGEIALAGPEACRRILPGAAIPPPPAMAAVAVRSSAAGRTRAFLGARGVRALAGGPGRVVTRPEDGAGAAFVFHDAGADPFAAP